MLENTPRVALVQAPEGICSLLAHYEHTMDLSQADAVITGDIEAVDGFKGYADKPIILVMCCPGSTDILRAYQAGVTECLILPQPAENILHIVSRIINHSIAIRECRNMERRYHAALKAIPDLILHFKQGAILIDTYYYQEFPMPFDMRSAVGKRLTDAFADEPIMRTLEEAVNRCIANTELVDLTYSVQGRYREARIAPINHGTDEALIVIRDVTDMVLMNKEVSELRSLPAKMDQVIQLTDVILGKLQKVFGAPGKVAGVCES